MCLFRATGKDAETERNDGARISGKPKKAPYMQKLVDTVSLARGRNRIEKGQEKNKGMLQQKTDIMLEVQESVG